MTASGPLRRLGDRGRRLAAGIRPRVTALWAARNPREQGLALAIAAVLVAWAGLGRLQALRAAREEWAALRDARAARARVLDSAPVVSRALTTRAAELAAARSLDAETVLARVEKLLSAANLKAETGRPTSRDSGAALAHVLSLRADATNLAELVAFRRALDAAGLPLAMTGLEIEADPAAPERLRARIEITALQPK